MGAIAGALTLIPVGVDLIKLIAGLVHQRAPVAQAANPQPGTGAVRGLDVLQYVAQTLQSLATAGQIPQASIPPNAALQTLIETLVQGMKLPGGVLADSSTPAVATGTLVPSSTNDVSFNLKQGQRLIVYSQ